MGQLRAGYLLCVSAGVTAIVAALVPWAAVPGAGTFTPMQLRLYEPAAVAVLAGMFVAVLGLLRTPWAALAAMGDALVTIAVALSVHGDLLGALAALGTPLGTDYHVEGFGLYALMASGLLAVVAAAVTSVQASPPVLTGKPGEEAL